MLKITDNATFNLLFAFQQDMQVEAAVPAAAFYSSSVYDHAEMSCTFGGGGSGIFSLFLREEDKETGLVTS